VHLRQGLADLLPGPFHLDPDGTVTPAEGHKGGRRGEQPIDADGLGFLTWPGLKELTATLAVDVEEAGAVGETLV
jgi:hypothetical protein